MLSTKPEEEILPVRSPGLFLPHWEGQALLDLPEGRAAPVLLGASEEGRGLRYKVF